MQKEAIITRNYLTESSTVDEIFEWINKENFNSEELKQFIQNNIDFFSSKNFRQKLIDKWAEWKNKNDMIMIIFLITFIDNINYNLDVNQNILNELNKTKSRVDEIVKLNEEQKKVISLYIKKDIQRKKLEEEISIYKEITKKQSNNLKENIWTIELLESTIEKHKKLWLQLNSLIKEAKEVWIFIEVANSKWELRINTLAISAIEKQSIHIPSERTSATLNETENKWTIIKAWDYRNIEEFKFKEIVDENTPEELEEFSDPISVKLILDRVSELEISESTNEEEIKTLRNELNKEKKSRKKIEKLKKSQETEINELRERLNKQEALLLKHRIKTSWLTIADDKKD